MPKLTPTTVETEAARQHRASIKTRLDRDFKMVRFFRSGSFANGTSISGYSDVDYMASIPTEQRKKSLEQHCARLKNPLLPDFRTQA